MSKTTVLYKDVAPGADEDASVSAAGQDGYSDISLTPFGVEPAPVATLELNNWLLSGTFKLKETQRLAFWSSELSGEDCAFANPPSITFDFTNQYSSTGITLVFDRANGNYCRKINVKWMQGDTIKADSDFFPDGTTYFCKQTASSYDKIIVTFLETSLPYRYDKVEHIVFGVHRQFGMAELRSASVVNEMDVVSESLPISTFKWTLDSREDVDFMFQLKQPVEIKNDDHLIGVYYIDSHNRKTQRIYDIRCHDALGVLDGTPFDGGVYTDKSAKELLADVVGGDFEIVYSEDVSDTALSGVLRSGTKRNAIQQILFAWGVCMATDGGAALRVFNVSNALDEIGKDRTFYGVTVDTKAIVTEVRVTAHVFTQDENGSVEIGGVKYSDTQSVYAVKNPNVTANDKQNVKEFTGATLVSPENAQSVAQRLYDWYSRRSTTKASIVWRGESLGDYVLLPNGWGDNSEGTITKMELKLSNTVVAKCESVGV